MTPVLRVPNGVKAGSSVSYLSVNTTAGLIQKSVARFMQLIMTCASFYFPPEISLTSNRLSS